VLTRDQVKDWLNACREEGTPSDKCITYEILGREAVELLCVELLQRMESDTTIPPCAEFDCILRQAHPGPHAAIAGAGDIDTWEEGKKYL
tara:strand:+ start:5903 stop:6172 length:270 start_codon:yes stop_codon:yes gene_type:complete